MKTTLVIMAAGLGSRYGGDKQLDGIGPHGEMLMEYAVYDALRAGFRKVVWIIQRGMRERLDERVGARVRGMDFAGDRVEAAYAYQDFDAVPDFYQVPPERVKPFGTGHALLCAAGVVEEPFCVVNADDYYGVDAYRVMREALLKMPPEGHAAMVGYVLSNTVSRGGTVSRGICKVVDGRLKGVTERLKIGYNADGVLQDAVSEEKLSPDEIVSMNMWGFTPWIFPVLNGYFSDFLRRSGGDITAECQLPTMVNAQMEADRLSVEVLRSHDAWFGMTYREDRETVAEKLRALHHNGTYPESLWG